MKATTRFSLALLSIILAILFGLLVAFRYDIAQIIIQFVGTAALLLTLWVYYRQLIAMSGQLQAARDQLDASRQGMSEQLAVMRQGSDAQNILALANFLQAEDVRAARAFVFQKLKRIHFSKWTQKDKLVAAKVCSTYGVAGVVLQTVIMPKQPFLENWGSSIRRSFDILRPLVEEMRNPENAGPSYWSTYEWLYLQVVEKYPNLGAQQSDIVDSVASSERRTRRRRVALRSK